MKKEINCCPQTLSCRWNHWVRSLYLWVDEAVSWKQGWHLPVRMEIPSSPCEEAMPSLNVYNERPRLSLEMVRDFGKLRILKEHRWFVRDIHWDDKLQPLMTRPTRYWCLRTPSVSDQSSVSLSTNIQSDMKDLDQHNQSLEGCQSHWYRVWLVKQ